jgi:hypothetical protein
MSEPNTAEQQHLARWQDRLQDAIDQVLSPAEMLQVHTHIAACTVCTRAQRRMLALDQRLRNEFAAPATPESFDQGVFAKITALELDKRAAARQQELQEYEGRLSRLRGGWRELLRFHLGNIIGGLAAAAAVVWGVAASWPTMTSTMTKDLVGAQTFAWLPQGWSNAFPATVMGALGIAAAAIWITRRLDSRLS